MTEEENYHFDVSGFLIVPGVLAKDEVEACNRALNQKRSRNGMLGWEKPLCDPFVLLNEHPVLCRYLEEICGAGFFLDRQPEVFESRDVEDLSLTGGSEWQDWSRSYLHQNGVRLCKGVGVWWALENRAEGNGGLVVIPASHKS